MTGLLLAAASSFKVIPMLYGLVLGSIDSILLSATKAVSIGSLAYIPYMLIIMAAYGFQPLIFLSSLNGESMTIMNLLWDVMSNIIVSCVGILYYKEHVSNMKYIGIILSIISLSLLAYNES